MYASLFRYPLGVLVIAASMGVFGCLEERPKKDDGDTKDAGCETCHELGPVHAAHLESDNPALADITCNECHPPVTEWVEETHMNDQLDVTFDHATLAVADGASPRYENGTCYNVYCHGATLSGGTATTPSWRTPDEKVGTCGSCHSLPPTVNHVDASNCTACHTRFMTEDGALSEFHLNGTVEIFGTP